MPSANMAKGGADQSDRPLAGVYACFTKRTEENTRATLAICICPHLPS